MYTKALHKIETKLEEKTTVSYREWDIRNSGGCPKGEIYHFLARHWEKESERERDISK